MRLFLNFSDIDNDQDRAAARDTFNSMQAKCSTTYERWELRHDIVAGYIDTGERIEYI